ncbi:MAG: hypothetical protein U1D70_13030 [Methylobacter sp.]|nr:hypothetical protein [Methylobacter sp.]MDP2427175.1 hypothetical protein [Methylobacter sp.]MDP3056682.1 hypothetical protein [Methylobacter sp.]MDZ4219931.1 hypothetical protein [Methylobacter sp.]
MTQDRRVMKGVIDHPIGSIYRALAHINTTSAPVGTIMPQNARMKVDHPIESIYRALAHINTTSAPVGTTMPQNARMKVEETGVK